MDNTVCSHIEALDNICVNCLSYLRIDELLEVWGNVEEDSVYGSREGDPTEEEDEQHEVGIGG